MYTTIFYLLTRHYLHPFLKENAFIFRTGETLVSVTISSSYRHQAERFDVRRSNKRPGQSISKRGYHGTSPGLLALVLFDATSLGTQVLQKDHEARIFQGSHKRHPPLCTACSADSYATALLPNSQPKRTREGSRWKWVLSHTRPNRMWPRTRA